MNSLERAKRFLAEKGKKLALVAIPLAALTVAVPESKAAVIFSSGSWTPSSTGDFSSFSTSCVHTTTPVAPNGSTGIKMYGSGGWSISASGGSGSGVFQWNGAADGGEYIGTMPVSWNFNVTASGSNASTDWFLTFLINGVEVGTFNSGGTGNFTGSGLLTINTPNVNTWQVNLNLYGSATSPASFSFEIPNSSIDLNPEAGSLPEPASIFMLVPGLGYIVWRRRKQQA